MIAGTDNENNYRFHDNYAKEKRHLLQLILNTT